MFYVRSQQDSYFPQPLIKSNENILFSELSINIIPAALPFPPTK